MKRNRFRTSNPTVRTITVKFDGVCIGCGGPIKAGQSATYYPPGSRRSHTGATNAAGELEHIADTWDEGSRTSMACFNFLKSKGQDDATAKASASKAAADRAGVNDYAGDGLDSRYEDDGAEICGR